jgi:hypothetical protein
VEGPFVAPSRATLPSWGEENAGWSLPSSPCSASNWRSIGLDAAFPPDLSRAYRSSPVALDRRGAWLRALPVEDGRWRIRADLDRTDPAF